MQLEIKRNTAVVASVEIDEKTVFTKKLMGEHKIRSEFYVEAPLNLQIGDYIEFRGEVFTINRVPGEGKQNTKTIPYSIDFEGVIYNLFRKRLRSNDGLVIFSYVGTALDQLNLLISNINSIDPGWSIGQVDNTDELRMDYSRDSCRTALTRIADKYGLQFSLSGKQISLKKAVGSVTLNRFEYGRGKGLYSLKRQQVSDQNIVTKVFGYGGKKNIPYDYRNRAKQLVFESKSLSKNTGLYGVIEGDFIDENIYPKRTGTVTAAHVNPGDMTTIPPDWPEYYIEDSSIDFDLNTYRIEGETWKVVFKSGDMSGYEFDIDKFDYEAKRIYFNIFSDADGYTLPSDLNQPQIGDTYTLININMPQEYIDAAEAELEAKTQEYLDQNCIPQVIYDLDIDPRYVKSHGIILDVGDMVTLFDEQLGIDTLIRVSELSYPLVNPNKVKAVIADFVPYTLQERSVKTAVQAKKETVFVEARSAELARRNTARLNQLRDYLLDQDGYFTMPIRPRSIETLYLSVGAVASDFRVNGAIFRDNYNGDPNALYASACSLTHLQLEIDLGYTWQISAGNFSGLTSGTAYYLYAKCSKTQLTGTWVLTPDVIKSDPGDGFFYFGTGVLLPVDAEGIRKFMTQYGKTYINGREITTGRIQSIDDLTYFDLDAGEIGGIIKFRNTYGNYQDINDIDYNFVGADQAGAASSAESAAKSFANSLYSQLDNIKQDAVVNGQTIIAGGYINTNLIETNALFINSQNVNGLGALALLDSLNYNDVGADQAGAASSVYSSLNAAKQDAVVGGNTLIIGGYLNTNFLEVGSIQANRIVTSEITSLGAVTAGTFNLGNGNFLVDVSGHMTAVGATIKSSASGQRVEIRSSTNEMKFFNSSNQEIFSIDADGGQVIVSGYGTLSMDNVSASNYLRVQSYKTNTQVPNGAIFQRSDGFICYKDLSGNIYKCSRESY